MSDTSKSAWDPVPIEVAILNEQEKLPPARSWDEARPQPLSNLYHFNIIMSPSHEEEEEEGREPAVGDMVVDFDEPAIEPTEDNNAQAGHQETSSYSSDTPVAAEDKNEDDVVSVDESILEIAMFEAVLQHNSEVEAEHQDEVEAIRQEEEIAPLPVVIVTKRPATDPKDVRPIKKLKKEIIPEIVPSPVIQAEPRKLPPTPRRKRPNCLFVNHFGTRLNDKGQAVRINTPAKNRPARISSEESVSIRTKVTASTGRSSKSSSTKKTPIDCVVSTTTPSITRSGVPSVVSIVTPNMKKPIKSSCLEDITMEEDEIAPTSANREDTKNSANLPYINSMSEHAPHSPMHNRMMQGMIPGPMPGVNFGRPFPLLQRRAFLTGCHPGAFGSPGWHATPYPMHFAPQMSSFPGPPPPHSSSASASSKQSQWKKPWTS